MAFMSITFTVRPFIEGALFVKIDVLLLTVRGAYAKMYTIDYLYDEVKL